MTAHLHVTIAILLLICGNVMGAKFIGLSLDVNAAAFWGTLTAYTVSEDGSLGDSVLVTKTVTCGFLGCPSLRTWGSKGIAFVQLMGTYSPPHGIGFYMIDSSLNVTIVQLPTNMLSVVTNDENYYEVAGIRENTMGLYKWNPATGDQVLLNTSSGYIANLETHLDTSPESRALYSINTVPPIFYKWDLVNNNMVYQSFVDVNSLSGIALHQSSHTPYVISPSGTVYSVNTNNQFFGNITQISVPAWHIDLARGLLVDNSGNSLYFFNYDPYLFKVDLTTKAMSRVKLAKQLDGIVLTF